MASARFLSLALVSFICAAAALAPAEVVQPVENAEEHALPLPRWSEQELRTFRDSLPSVSGAEALPSNGQMASDINDLIRTPLSSGPRLDHFFNPHDSELSPRLQASDMRLFLPEAILGQPAAESRSAPVQQPTPLASLKDVSSEFLAACAQSLPQEYLIDPDQLVPEIQNQDLMRLLEFHAQDARIKLYVLITGRDQQLPAGVELEKIASGGLLQSDSCLLVYPLGEPWRTRLFVSRSVHHQISTPFLHETIEACLRESLQSSNEHDQLRRYTIHLSTRLFWLQKALRTDSPPSPDQAGQSLAEFSAPVKAPAVEGRGLGSFVNWSAGSVLLLGLAGFGGRRFLHHRQLKKRRRIWLLAEPETIPRLGGAFTGGGGAMIRYG